MLMQLNFLGDYATTTQVVEEFQNEFWDQEYNLIKPAKRNILTYEKVENFFTKLDYRKKSDYTGYWQYIKPKNDSEVFQRWLFAFMSVHTSWKANVAGYAAIKNWKEWLNDDTELLKRITESRVGMQNNRTKFISEFAKNFLHDPSAYYKKDDETWSEFRNRLEDNTLGLGMAKTSFAIEMCYPNEARVTCLDTHMFQAYGLDQTKDAKKYEALEQHWVEMSNMWNIPPYIARCLYWDTKQGYTDSRYWSYVLED